MSGLVGGISCFDSRDELFSEFPRAKESLGTKAATTYAATLCDFFLLWRVFFVKLEILYLPSGTWKM